MLFIFLNIEYPLIFVYNVIFKYILSDYITYYGDIIIINIPINGYIIFNGSKKTTIVF